MANIASTNPLSQLGIDYSFHSKGNMVQWTPLTFTGLDAGVPYDDFGNTDRSVQVSGTFGAGGSVLMEGSNDGVTYFQLKDQGGTLIALTAAGLVGFQPGILPRFVRPRVTAGDGTTSLTVLMLCRRPMNS